MVICSRSQEGVDKAVASLKELEDAASGRVHGLKCDVGSAEDVEKLSAFAHERLGTVHIWLNNAGQVSIYAIKPQKCRPSIESLLGSNDNWYVIVGLLYSRAPQTLSSQKGGFS